MRWLAALLLFLAPALAACGGGSPGAGLPAGSAAWPASGWAAGYCW
jgi:hypothetical protein